MINTPGTDPGEGRCLPRVDDGPAVAIRAVPADPESRHRTLATRALAAVLAVALVGGGALLVIDALGSNDGSESPEAAVERFLESLSAEDLLGAAESILPSERETLIEGAVDISEELVRLEVFTPFLDLGSLNGIAMRFDNLSLRSVQIHPDIAQVFVERGSTRSSVDVSAFPLGDLARDRLTEEQIAYSSSISPSLDPDDPISVVRRDGRWYVSLWYSVAEKLRLEAGRPPPSVSGRLVPIGAESPEAAVERLIREFARVDPRLFLGMLDPVEMSVLYDYTPVFLPGLESAANDRLQAAADTGRSWSVGSIDLGSETTGDLAVVTIRSINASFESPTVDGGISMKDGRISLAWSALDIIGRRIETEFGLGAGCTTMTNSEIGSVRSFDSCNVVDDELGPRGIIEMFLGLGEIGPVLTQPAGVDVVVSRVDGRWFVSPVRTGAGMMLDLLDSLDPPALDDLLDLAPSMERVVSDGAARSFTEAGLLPFSSIDNRHVDDFDVVGVDLVNLWAPSDFAMDLAPVAAQSLMTGWLPEAGDAEVVRAVEVISASESGGTTVFVLQLADDTAVTDTLDRLLLSTNATVNGSLIEMSRPARDSVVVTGYSDRLVVATGLPGTPIGILRSAIAWQVPD